MTREPPLGLAEIMALEPRPCTACARLERGVCQQYDRKLPEPKRESRCVHFVEKVTT